MPTIDFQPLLNVLGTFWRQHRELPLFKIFWEGLIRSVDDLWLQLRQVQDSRFLATVPPFILNRFLYRRLEGWRDTGVFHRHVKKEFTAAANQAVFYPGVFVEPTSCRVYLEGKLLDAEGGDFEVVYDQDATQPGTNPRGSRILLRAGVPSGSSIVMVADRETLWIDHTFTGPSSLFSFADPVNPLSARAVIESFEITSQMVINPAGTLLSFLSGAITDPNTPDTRRFRVGEVIQVVDTVAGTQELSVTAESASLAIPVPVATTAKVYRMIRLDVSPGKVLLEQDRLSLEGQFFPPNTRVRVVDALGPQTFDITTPKDVLELSRSVNPAEAEVLYFSGTIWRGIEIDESGLRLGRSFQKGVRFSIYADYHLEHDHASWHVELTASSDRASVPRTRPWVLTAGGSELPAFPIEVYVDGMYQPSDRYVFLPTQETYTVRFVHGGSPNFLPAGTRIDLFYVDEEDNRLHKHLNDRYETADGQMSFELSEARSARYPTHLTVDGVLQNAPGNYSYTPFLDFLHIFPPLVDGTLVRIRGMRLELPYVVDVDVDVEEEDFVEADLPVSRVVYASYLQDGIEKGPGGAALTKLAIHVSGDAPVSGFSIAPLVDKVSGFTLKASAVIEDAWFADALVDEATAWRNFGSILDFQRPSGEAYSRVLQALFAAYYRGSQDYTLENFVCVIMGSAFLDLAGRLIRIQDDGETRAAVVEDEEGQKSYGLSKAVPDRLDGSKALPRFYALTAYARLLELSEENFPWLPIVIGRFGVDFDFADQFDRKVDATISGTDPSYEPDTLVFRDPLKDFVAGTEGEVWRGDLVSVVWSDASVASGRVVEVIDKSTLRVRLTVPEVSVGYGQQGYAGGPPGVLYGYGGLQRAETIVSYSIAARKTSRLDVFKHLDRLDSDRFDEMNAVLVPLLRSFVFLMRFHWEGLREGNLDGVQLFLDTAKWASTAYIAFTMVNEGEGLQDAASVGLAEGAIDIEMIPNLLALGLGAVDGGSPIGASIGVAT